MQKIRKIVSITIMATMLFSTMGIGAFAATDTDLAPTQGSEPETQPITEPATQPIEEDNSLQENLVQPLGETPSIDSITFKQVSGTKKVSIAWTMKGITSVNVYQKKENESTYVKISPDITRNSFTTNELGPGNYSFKVEAKDDTSVYKEGSFSVVTPTEITSLKTFSGYESIHLEWNKVEGATKYFIKKYNDKNTLLSTVTMTTPASSSSIVKYKSKGIPENTTYRYSVAYEINNGLANYISGYSDIKSDQCVRPMYISVKLKRTRTLTCHDSKKITVKFKKGTRLKTCGFVNGRYKFYYKGHRFFVSKISTTSRYAIYQKNGNYSVKEAEYFVNDTGIGSSTKQMLWTSQNTQHIYYFTGSKGKWKCQKNWECATGKPNSPTPCTLYKTIGKKIRTRHHLSYWSCFSTLTAFHGKLSSWNLGKPVSGGCIRNYNSNAKFIYSNIKKKSRAMIF